MRPPYIGITDVPSAEWLKSMLRFYIDVDDRGGLVSHQLHAGVMMSYKTLNGLETKWSAVWPKKEGIANIFLPTHFALLNTLHYADYEGIDVEEGLLQAVHFGGPNLDALQLDMIWPDPFAVRCCAARHPHLRIILQVGSKALAQVNDDPKTLIERLEQYEGIVHDVLLDKSGGRGQGLDAALLEPFIYELRARRPDLGIAVAGGLGPDTLHLVEPLIRKFPGLSIDAQGQLRPSGNSLDPIDRTRAEDYLHKAVAMFRTA